MSKSDIPFKKGKRGRGRVKDLNIFGDDFPTHNSQARPDLSKVFKSYKPFLCSTILKFTRNWEFEFSAILS